VSRKNLSRTVIEGGRAYYNCYQRRESHRIARAKTREWLDRVANDLVEADATVPPPRPSVHKSFYDKLAPAHRWLVAQVGRPWSKVYSELCARFDTRTVAGRHVVHDHMLDWVRRHDEPYRGHSRYDLVIDAHGILRKPLWFGLSWPAMRAKVRTWAAGRACALTYRGWWWFRRERIGPHAVRLVSEGPMSRKQVRYLERLPAEFRRDVVVASPWPAR